MTLRKIDIYQLARPLVAPFNTAFGDTAALDTILVRLESDEGIGWGEATPWSFPFYSAEWGSACYATAQALIGPQLIGKNIASGQELQDLLSPIKGNYFAKSAFDLAFWDLEARRQNLPLWKLLGGESGTIDVGADFGVLEKPEYLLEKIEGALEAGFPRIKLKIRHGWDLDVLRLVRQTFPDAVFHADANSGYTLDDADLFRAMDELNLAMIEQPLAHDDLLDHAELATLIDTPICLDESITSVARARKAIEIGAADFINIKPGRVGGITNAVGILEVARTNDIPCWIGGMLESAIGASHCMALATLPGMGYAADIFPTDRFFARDLTPQDVNLSAPGQITAFDGPGIGCAPELDQVAQFTVQHTELSA
jgi:O-succinylbenzoate synthase